MVGGNLKVVLPEKGEMAYLGEGRAYLGDAGWRETIQINYKMKIMQQSFERFSQHFETNFH